MATGSDGRCRFPVEPLIGSTSDSYSLEFFYNGDTNYAPLESQFGVSLV